MHFSTTPRRIACAATIVSSLLLAACGSLPSGGAVPGQLSDARPPAAADASRARPRPSDAATARDYRRDAARRVYDLNKDRIYAGKLPPELYAVGTLQVDLDAGGKVQAMNWLRAPSHAPEVVAEIERTVLAAAPYPVPARLGKVTWTDTWLWDEGGHFQLDTLSEGQLQPQDPR
ncbi:hypothetical protein QTH87_03970 [Variovorax sp. J22P168]|uniref:hypothetical protein n=1 Tax=Variovorax jilinensis TaxID=3053513 RepID=UPI002576E4C7|nr:hypothetical protein [Variovorax sp. J22P168]MDM0011590.1 hypothetical protein [Variovorax sp. J22P168]